MVSIRARDFETEKFDVLVIGSGLAGLSAAYSAVLEGANVAIACAYPLEDSNSYLAKGGIAAAMDCKKKDRDSVELHLEDTLKTGKGLCDREIAAFVVSQAEKRIKELIELGLEFDLDEDGEIDFGLEGGHSKKRVLHIEGDNTGKGLSEFMLKLAREEGAHFFEGCLLEDFALNGKRTAGAFFLENCERKAIESDSVVLATGGYASLFECTTNSNFSLGSGISAAKRCGAELMDLEFVQFHPTTIMNIDEHLLVTESVRGESGMIIDEKGKRIVNELATRDEASRAIYRHTARGGKAFLDVRHLEKRFLEKRFPSFCKDLSTMHINPEKDLVPITPAAHYTIGGVRIGRDARTSIAGLYAAGEVSCSGMHGANRLPCNSLLESLVMGFEAGKNAGKEKKQAGAKKPESRAFAKDREKQGNAAMENPLKGTDEIRKEMWLGCGIERNRQGLMSAIERIKGIHVRQDSEKEFDAELTRFSNAKELSLFVLESALSREESRGVHYRIDFPREDIKFLKHIII